MARSYNGFPENFQTLYDASEIATTIQRMGKDISLWAKEIWDRSHTDILTVPVLRGGIFFFTDLVREISHSVEIVPTFSQSYEDSENNVQRKDMKVDLGSIPARGRAILLIDDICDSGRTLEVMSAKLREAGALEVRSAVLVKRILDTKTFAPDWVGFEYKGPEWLVGYGMDDCNRWRNLDSIYIIQKA